VSGLADILKLGTGTSAAIDDFRSGNTAGGISDLAQEGGRIGGIILFAVGEAGPTELKANRLLDKVQSETTKGGNQTVPGTFSEKVVNRAGEKFTGSDSRQIS